VSFADAIAKLSSCFPRHKQSQSTENIMTTISITAHQTSKKCS